MVKAVRFHKFGGIDVLQVDDIELRPVGPQDVLVDVRAAAINPGEAAIRSGAFEAQSPTKLPCGEGTDLAGVVKAVGGQVTGCHAGDEVLGYSWERSSHAQQVVVPANQLVHKPVGVSWEAAGSLGVAGVTAWAAVHAVAPQARETVLVSGATGGVGTIVVQLLKRAGADVLAIASERHADWLAAHGATLVAYGPDLETRVRAAAPGGVDAVIDLFGPQYVELALALGVPPARIDTIISFEAAAAAGAKTEGSAEGTTPAVLEELASLIADGQLEIPIAARYPLAEVQAAFAELEQRHTLGKIVLLPS
jgi:NADPH:quinone reductase-like Zn-dependent oxidoreductase